METTTLKRKFPPSLRMTPLGFRLKGRNDVFRAVHLALCGSARIEHSPRIFGKHSARFAYFCKFELALAAPYKLML